jgi:hypothetical protein
MSGALELAFKNISLKNNRLTSENNKLKAKILRLGRINKEVKKELAQYVINVRASSRGQNLVPFRITVTKRKANIKRILILITKELVKIGFVFDNIVIIETSNQDIANDRFSIEYTDKRDSQYHTALKCLYYKDLSGMSDRNYQIFRKGMALGSKIQPLHYLRRIRITSSINLNAKRLSTGKTILK